MRSTISLGVVAAFLLVCCMMACFCCLKKRGEVYILRNTQGIDNHHAHLQNSDESEAERGEYNREEQRRIHDELQEWHAEQRTNHERATQDQRFSQNILLQNRNIAGVDPPLTHPHVHAQILDNTHVENEML